MGRSADVGARPLPPACGRVFETGVGSALREPTGRHRRGLLEQASGVGRAVGVHRVPPWSAPSRGGARARAVGRTSPGARGGRGALCAGAGFALLARGAPERRWGCECAAAPPPPPPPPP